MKNKRSIQNSTSKNQKTKILIMEDETAQAYALEAKLSIEGFEVRGTTSGKTGLSLAEKIKPDLILLDIVLPDIDGFEILKELKEDRKTADIPVIIISQMGQKENIDQGMKLGAEDYLVKSEVNLDKIVARVKQLLHHK